MNCPRCQASNPAGAKFCINCGNPLHIVCSNCKTELPATAQFCFACGAKVSASPVAAIPASRLRQYLPPELLAKLESARAIGGMRGERRVVTMLFSDVKGSTAAAEHLDPEEWAQIMNGAFEPMIAPIYKYEGTLASLMGDAILAFFGAPIAHEDDPQRAVLAALEILHGIRAYKAEVKSRWGLDLDVRVGINTGLVVVGEVGSDLRVEYTALGDPINVAARMEQTAQPGTAQISDATFRLVEPLFDVQELGFIEVKGRAQPVRAYRVAGAKLHPGSLRGIPGAESPLVGRGGEMASLWRAVDALRQGSGQIVSVVGDAGLGKSRLVAELRKGLAVEGLVSLGDPSDQAAVPRPWPMGWHEGHAFSYQTSTPYAPFLQLVGELVGSKTRPAGEGAGAYTGIKERAAALVAQWDSRHTPFLATLLGVTPEGEDLDAVRYLQPPQIREGIFQAVSALVEGLATANPSIFVLEDLHWWDKTSLELVERFAALTDSCPLMLVGLFRPQRQEASWRFHELGEREYPHRYTPVFLEPLPESDCRELMGNLLRIEGLPAKVQALVLEKAEGNPFFVEEVIRSLQDSGAIVQEDGIWRASRDISEVAVPDSLVGLLTSRLDQLDEATRGAAQAASVVGRNFDLETLKAVFAGPGSPDEAVRQLLRRGLVLERERLPHRQYAFKHALTQESAYASLLLSTRRQFHLRVAEHLERTQKEGVNQIAQHLLEAREPLRALPYLLESGEAAARSYATAEAIGYFQQAISIAENTPDLASIRRAYEGLGGAQTFGYQVPQAVETYHKMSAYARAHADSPMEVSATNKLSLLLGFFMGQKEEAMQQLEASGLMAASCQDIPGLAESHMTSCYVLNSAGDFEAAHQHLSEAARIGNESGILEAKLFGKTHVTHTLTYMTRFEEAWSSAQEALQLALEAGHKGYEAELRTEDIPVYHLRNGHLGLALESARAGMELSGKIGASLPESAGALAAGQVSRLQGDYQQALDFYQRALAAGQASGMPFLQAAALAGLGSVHLDISLARLETADSLHSQAIPLLELPVGRVMGAAAWTEIGFCLLAAGQPEKAAEYFDKARTVSTMARLMVRPQLLMGCAMVALTRQQPQEAARLLQEAGAFAEERGMRFMYPFISLADGQLRTAASQQSEALDCFSRATALASEMGMRPMVWQGKVEEARALAALGRPGDAQARCGDARQTIQEMAELFTDSQLRGQFVESALAKVADAARS